MRYYDKNVTNKLFIKLDIEGIQVADNTQGRSQVLYLIMVGWEIWLSTEAIEQLNAYISCLWA